MTETYAPQWSPCRDYGHAWPPVPGGRCRDCDTVIASAREETRVDPK